MIDFAAINRAALTRLPGLVESWLPGGRFEGDEYVVKNSKRHDTLPGSFKINTRTGKWAEFAALAGDVGSAGGDPISLFAYLEDMKQGEAAKRLAQHLGIETDLRGETKRPIVPVPADAPSPEIWRHPKHGYPVAGWRYHNAESQVIGYVVRVEYVDGRGRPNKDYLPLCFCEVTYKNGSTGRAWRSAGFPEPRPLYRLPWLLAAPDAPVIVTEGEKCADAVERLFPGSIGITPAHGAKSPHRTDWTPCRGRTCVIWPDHDEPGRQFADRVARLLYDAGAVSVTVVAVPGHFPEKWDLADDLPDGVTIDDLRALLATAEPLRAVAETEHLTNERDLGATAPMVDVVAAEYPFQASRPEKFRYGMGRDGTVWIQKNIGDREKPQWVDQCTPVSADAWLNLLNDERSAGLRVALLGRDDERREIDVPREYSGRKGGEILDRLTRAGLRLAGAGDHKGSDAVLDMLRYASPNKKITQVPRAGWHHLSSHAPLYACPSGEVVGAPEGARIDLVEIKRLPQQLRRGGTFEGWLQTVDRIARLEVTPPYWILGLIAGFAGPLMQLLSHPTCGCCIVGLSSIGKTTTLEAATSVFAAPELTDRGLMTSADATPGALEEHAERATGATLALDELRLARPDQLAQIVHNLASDSGRSRLTRDSTMGMARAWSCFVLMSSERSVRQIIEDAGHRTKVTAGIVVRVADISVQGVAVPPDELRAIRDGLRSNFGWAGPAFVTRLIEEGLHADPQALRELLARTVFWIAGDKASPIEQRAAEPLAIALMAGLIAQRFKLLPDALDLKAAIASLWKQFKESDSAAALNPLDEAVDNLRHAVRSKLDISIKKLPLAQERNNRDAEGFYDDSAVYLSKDQLERMSGMGPGEVARELHRRGMLIKGPGRYLLQPYVKGLGAVPSYALSRLHFGNTSEVVTEESLRCEAEQHRRMVEQLVRQADEIARSSRPQEGSQ